VIQQKLFGQVLEIRLPQRKPVGHEQTGLRPCLVIGDPGQHQRTNFPQYIICPITSTILEPGLMRVAVHAGMADLKLPGTVLLDQLQAVDVGRITGAYGRFSASEREPVRVGLKALFVEIFES
jgi:mRNA interferase MazF